ncbi:hypothetical protein FQA47_013926 [Oryzias melastigma]|uniref:Uncharacterized protein n=1 Tax=Oryzias melastigma TaxID=30732 RepID=A0A834CE88_ORYME|nr:hypothetical protein FQA47_013926 [Oryzias melastigma]
MGRRGSRTDCSGSSLSGELDQGRLELTWLMSTDTDIPLSSIQSIPSDNSEVSLISEKTIRPGKQAE